LTGIGYAPSRALRSAMRACFMVIVGLLARGWTRADILRNYPGITDDDIGACLRYASESLQAEKVYPLTPADGALPREREFPRRCGKSPSSRRTRSGLDQDRCAVSSRL